MSPVYLLLKHSTGVKCCRHYKLKLWIIIDTEGPPRHDGSLWVLTNYLTSFMCQILCSNAKFCFGKLPLLTINLIYLKWIICEPLHFLDIFKKEQEICLDFTVNIYIRISLINIFILYKMVYNWNLGGTKEAVDLTTSRLATLME